MPNITNTPHSAYNATSRRSYISVSPFQANMFTYTTQTVNFVTSGTLTAISSSLGATSTNCPKGRVLRENGRKLYPSANPGVTTYMVGVYDAQTLYSGFIDPNSPVFTVYNTDKSNFLADGVDPGPGGLTDNGAPVYTNSSVEARTTITAGTSITAGTNITADGMVYGKTGVGYPVGTGATGPQLTSIATAVTVNAITGGFTTFAASWTALETKSFTFINSFIQADDMIVAYITDNASFVLSLGQCTSSHQCAMYIRNVNNATNPSSLTVVLNIRFAIIKSALT